MTGQSPFAAGRDERGRAARSAHAVPPARTVSPRTTVLPAAVIAVACTVTAAATLLGGAPAGTVRVVLAVIACGVLLMLGAAVAGARIAGRELAGELRGARLAAQRGQAELQQMADRLLRGERPAPPPPAPARAPDGDLFAQLASEIEQSRYHAGRAMLRVAEKAVRGHSDQRVEIFVNLARRMQSLVHREIELLDDLEAKVEDPDLLKGLFTIDHLATRMRRQSESLAVLGGSASRRQWSRQVTMHEVLRAAVAEVEQYSRVKVVPPVDGVLRGGAVTDVIHLIAELVENATKFSAPHTTALLRAQQVAAGVAIEVEDRGLGIVPAEQQRMNDLLANPGQLDVDELLRDGRIGLYVVATLARRHGIRVRLQNNIYGGTQAVVVLPGHLLEQHDHGHGLPRDGHGGQPLRGAAGRPAAGDPAAGLRASGPLAPVPPSAGPAAPVPPDAAPLPARRHSAGPAAGGRPAAGDGEAGDPAGHGGDRGGPAELPAERPPLPRRQVQAAPAARQPGGDGEGGAQEARGAEPPADQMTSLMADFLRGSRRAEDEDSLARD